MKNKTRKTGKKTMKDYTKGKKLLSVWIDEDVYKELQTLSGNIDVNSVSDLMRFIIFE